MKETTPPDPTQEISAWFVGRLPDDWFTGEPTVTVDREEIIVTGTLPDVSLEGDGGEAALATAREARVSRFREDTRQERMNIADEAENRFDRKVSWGVRISDNTLLFTHLALPIMTRLRQKDRIVLDTLVDAGVARSRSEALAWCVRLVGKHQAEWISSLRDALVGVEKARLQGPEA